MSDCQFVARVPDHTDTMLNSLSRTVYQRSRAAGWHNDPVTGDPIDKNIPEMLALVHSEVSEALEGQRKDLMDDHLPDRPMLEVELADAVIRIAHIAGYLNLDLGGALVEKMEYNLHREDHKTENRAKPGGKKF